MARELLTLHNDLHWKDCETRTACCDMSFTFICVPAISLSTLVVTISLVCVIRPIPLAAVIGTIPLVSLIVRSQTLLACDRT